MEPFKNGVKNKLPTEVRKNVEKALKDKPKVIGGMMFAWGAKMGSDFQKTLQDHVLPPDKSKPGKQNIGKQAEEPEPKPKLKLAKNKLDELFKQVQHDKNQGTMYDNYLLFDKKNKSQKPIDINKLIKMGFNEKELRKNTITKKNGLIVLDSGKYHNDEQSFKEEVEKILIEIHGGDQPDEEPATELDLEEDENNDDDVRGFATIESPLGWTL
eukprot:CAMPEP_0114354512 /NCGR_PEP_ID=MMETSP0101-20121206/19522_1 /TAXON_ID=38822 ORGANISM="Pteridomonas danica, Strain PT" /NCGR_SAMPLE_ID=MMETSP0101 /ASSEMBLY_ACC=CAM_ASM_000211 /LENGTH=212 /DNA_ID=CAMNT_0001495991 /DNA_START=77 /DNA_END=715 /DNA_ORIENTATION=+